MNSESEGWQNSEICKILLSEDSELFWLEDSELWRILNEFRGEGRYRHNYIKGALAGDQN